MKVTKKSHEFCFMAAWANYLEVGFMRNVPLVVWTLV